MVIQSFQSGRNQGPDGFPQVRPDQAAESTIFPRSGAVPRITSRRIGPSGHGVSLPFDFAFENEWANEIGKVKGRDGLPSLAYTRLMP